MNTTQTVAELRAQMAKVFAGACKTLGLDPLEASFGARSSATFATAREASELAGATSIESTHWDPKVDPDFDRDEYQVAWG